jgi:4-amino-4-deoxy-L-arabinose transferase-like glycosyltransferase
MSKSYASRVGRTISIVQSEDANDWADRSLQSTRWPPLAQFALFVLIWTLYGVISASPAAIHNDMAEAYAWGREFQLGYEKHPPFWAWIAGLWFEVFPHVDWAFILLAVFNAGLGLYGSWMLIGDFAEGDRRLAATALLLLTPFYTFLALKYNANSIFLSLWPWTMHFFVRSIDERRLAHSILFGIFIGIALLSKYFAVILAATCFVAALVHPARRAYFTSAAPYLSVLIATLVFAPHAWWLMRSHAPPVDYFVHKTGFGVMPVLIACVTLIAGVVMFHSIVITLIAFAKRSDPRAWATTLRDRWAESRFRVLTTLAVLPVVLTIVTGVVFRLRPDTNMTVGIFSLLPLLFVEVAGEEEDRRLYSVSRTLALTITLTALVLSPAIAFAKIWYRGDLNYTEPRKELALKATELWHNTTSLPLKYVAGSQRYEDAIAFYSSDHPHVFTHFDHHRAPWVTSHDLSRAGLLLVCSDTDKQCLESAANVSTPQSHRIDLSLVHSFFGYTVGYFSFVVTIVPPDKSLTPGASTSEAQSAGLPGLDLGRR